MGQFASIWPPSAGAIARATAEGDLLPDSTRCQEFTSTSVLGKLDKLLHEPVAAAAGAAKKSLLLSDEEKLRAGSRESWKKGILAGQ